MTITYIDTVDGCSYMMDTPVDEVMQIINKAKEDGQVYACFTSALYERVLIVISNIVAIKESVE